MLLLVACGAPSTHKTLTRPSSLTTLRVEPAPFQDIRALELPIGFYRRASPREISAGRRALEEDAQRAPSVERWEIQSSSLEQEGAACVASESARYEVEHQHAPGPMLSQFIEARCGLPLWTTGEAIGPMRRSSGLIEFEAWAPHEAMVLRARITHGAAGIADCAALYLAHRRSWQVRCPEGPADASEVIEFFASDPYDVDFATSQLFVVQDPALMRTFETRAPCGTAEELGVAVAERINALRASLGQAPLVYEAPQSAMNTLLTYPQFEFNYPGGFHDRPSVPRDVARAGWEVPVVLADGHDMVVETPLGACADEMTARFLRSPGERDILLSNTVTHLAVGVRFGPDSQQSIITTYEAFESVDSEVAREGIITLLQQARARDAGAPFEIIAMPAALTWAIEQLALGASIEATLRRATEELGEVPEGTRLFTYAATTLGPPPNADLRDASTLAVAVATPLRRRASARGGYLMFVLVGPE